MINNITGILKELFYPSLTIELGYLLFLEKNECMGRLQGLIKENLYAGKLRADGFKLTGKRKLFDLSFPDIKVNGRLDEEGPNTFLILVFEQTGFIKFLRYSFFFLALLIIVLISISPESILIKFFIITVITSILIIVPNTIYKERLFHAQYLFLSYLSFLFEPVEAKPVV
jgi:hypothetical protein